MGIEPEQQAVLYGTPAPVDRQPRVRGYLFFPTGHPPLKIRWNETYRLGAITVEIDPKGAVEPVLVLSTATWSFLQEEERRGGATPTLDHVDQEIVGALGAMRTKMIDLGLKGPRKVVDRRVATRPSNDRVEFVCRGISDLVAQMSTLMSVPEHTRSENQVTQVAKRYAELAGEMGELRKALTAAEGSFEIAQQQVIALMGGGG